MKLSEYVDEAKAHLFEEHPYAIFGGITELKDFVKFEEADLDLKIHMAKVVLCRNFSPAGGYCVLTDHNWFIDHFLESYHTDNLRPWLTDTIKQAMRKIFSDDIYSDQVLGTTFMFGILEFYAKYLLGWRPSEADFFDNVIHSRYRAMTLSDAINKLKKTKTELARSLDYIDKQSLQRLKEENIKEERWVMPRIADRLRIARNPMLHGEEYNFNYIGKYLCLMYALFWLTEEKRKIADLNTIRAASFFNR